MTRSVLFHYPILNVGGAEKSSVRMIKALADRGWDVTLVLTTSGGTLEFEIDPRVRVIRLRPRACDHHYLAASGLLAKIWALPDLLCYAVMRGIGALRMLPFLWRQYDAAAVLLTGTASGFVRRIVRAGVKAIWIRNDLSGADPTGQVSVRLRAAASGIDYFICVSEVSRESLVNAVPEARGKDVVVYNILDPDEMRARAHDAQSPFEKPTNGTLVLLSVCRLNERAKGLRRMACVCRALKDEGIAFHWYVVGDGSDREIIEAEISELEIDDRMTLLGQLANPFPAYRSCDVVAMLSRYEGLCGVINEARVLEKPVIATQVSGIEEQLTDGVNGLIVPQDEDAIIAGLIRVLTNAALRAQLATGGYPTALLNDEAKLDALEKLFLAKGNC